MFRWTARLAFGAVSLLIAVATLCPIDLRPKTGHVFLERFAAFFLLGALAAAAWPRSPRRDAAVIAAIAIALELAQRLVPTRDAHLIDALQKLSGGLAGLVLMALLLAVARSAAPRASAAEDRLRDAA
jgi:VanZ family protein